MASQGPLNPPLVLGNVVDDATVGTVNWVNPTEAATANATYANASFVGNAFSHYLKATNFGFSIPVGATIDGIVATALVTTSAGTSFNDGPIKLVKAGVIGGTDKDRGATNWPASPATITWGGAADLWGLAWTPADINASTFGVAVSVERNGGFLTQQAYVDAIAITVYYTTGGGGGSSTKLVSIT